MNVELLQKKMDSFFGEITAEELVSQLKYLGYSVVDINENQAFDLGGVSKCVCCDEVKQLTHCEECGNDIGIVDN